MSSVVRRLGLSQLPSGSATLFAALAVANVSGYIFYIVASRLLTATTYGALGALISIITICAVPATAIHTVAARRMAVLGEQGRADEIRSLLQMMIRSLAIVGGLLAAALLALSHLVARFLHLGSAAPAALLAAFVFVALVTPVLRGTVHGLLHYRALAASFMTTTVVRVGLGIALLAAGWGVTGALVAFLVAELSSNVPTVWALRSVIHRRPQVRSVPGVFRELQRASLAVAGFAAATNLDVAQVRHYFPNRASGLYAAASVVGRGVLVGSLAITLLMFPRFASSETHGAEARSARRWALLATAGIGVAATILVTAAGRPLITLVFGHGYGAAATVAAVSAGGSALYGLAGLLMYFQLAASSPAALMAIPAVAAQSIAIALWHGSILEVEWITAFVAAALLVASTTPLLARRRLGIALSSRGRPPPSTPNWPVTP